MGDYLARSTTNFDTYHKRLSHSSSRPVSVTSSTHPMLAESRFDFPPVPTTPRSFMSRPASASSTSLTVNYVPNKFSPALLAPGTGPYRRKGRGDSLALPKRGGGVEAFRSGEARIGNTYDDDYGDGHSKTRKKMKWTKFKWILLFANTLLTIYSLLALVVCLLIWFNVFKHSDIILAANYPELITSTIAATLGLFTSVVGWAGILLNNRPFLAIYTFLLWLVFAALVIPGYLSYKRRTFNLEGKINSQWSRQLGSSGRLRIQNELQCCGYYSPFVEATVSAACYQRSTLPGCKQDFLKFQRLVLKNWYTSVFGLVPAHVFVIVSGLLCSNHVTYRFGKGMTPKAYRLDMNSVAAIMDDYATTLAEKYGVGIADDIVRRSQSNLNLSTMSSMPLMNPSISRSSHYTSRGRYDSIGGRSPEMYTSS